VLETCPFASAALADADSVCRIHLGMAEGLAELTGGRVVIDELVAHDPRHASCRLRLHADANAAADAAPELRFTRRRTTVPTGRVADPEGPGC
jgi:hypothetical protein